MAATAVQQATVTDINTINWHTSERQSNINDHDRQQSSSMCSYLSGETYPSRCESNTPAHEYYSSSSNSEPKWLTKDIGSKYITTEGGDHPCTPSSEDNRTDSALKSIEKYSGSGTEIYSQNNTDFYVNGSKYTNNKSNTNKHDGFTGNKKKSDRSNKFPVSYLELQSQKFDFTKLKNNHTFDAITGEIQKEKKKNDGKNCRSSMLTTRDVQDFDVSELTLKLRGSLQSDFLSNELRLWEQPQSEVHTSDSGEVLRTIDEILKQYGISNKVPCLRTGTNNESDINALNDCQPENSNVSQNNETLSSLSETTHAKQNNDYVVSKSTEVLHMPTTSGNKAINNTSTNEPNNISASYRETNNLVSAATVSHRTNLSQNNETTDTYDNGENDLLRKYGSSVDYTITGSTGKYTLTGKTNYGRYDYGKAAAFTGDSSAPPTNTYAENESKKIENIKHMPATLLQQTEGSQVDVVQAAEPRKTRDIGYELHRSMGSSTDALELSISSERQRLRRVDTLITAASVNTPIMHVPKSLTTRFYSPQREMYKFRDSGKVATAYSNPMFPSASYRAEVAHKNNWIDSSYERESSSFLNKSASVPGNWGQNFQSGGIGRYGSSIDSRQPYLPYSSSRDYNVQYNNSTYNPLLMNALANQHNYNKNHTQTLANKIPETISNNKSKKLNPSPTKQRNVNLSRCPLKNGSSVSFSDGGISNHDLTGKFSYNKTVDMKKCSNINDSKSAYSIYSGFDFIRDLNKMREETLSMRISAANAARRKNMSMCSYLTCKPYLPKQMCKEEMPNNLTKDAIKKDKASNSGKTKQNSRKDTGSAASSGRFHECKNDSELTSDCGCRFQDSLEQRRTCKENKQKTNNSIDKKKPNIVPLLFTYKANAKPSLVLKQLPTKANSTHIGTAKQRTVVGTSYKS